MNKSIRCCGVLIGLAVGDKNHGPIHMATMLGESLLKNKGFKSDDYLNLLVDWLKKGELGADDTGPILADVFSEYISHPNMKISDAVDRVDRETKGQTGGVNPSHRGVCLAMYSGIEEKDLYNLSCEQTLLSHKNDLAQKCSFITNFIIRRSILGQKMEDIIQELLKMSYFKGDLSIQMMLKSYFLDLPEKSIPKDGFSPNVLKATLWFIKKYTNGVDLESKDTDLKKIFEKCLNHSFDFAGKVNYCPVLVGAIMGAICGSENIDKEMYSHCLSPERVLDVSKQLSLGWE